MFFIFKYSHIIYLNFVVAVPLESLAKIYSFDDRPNKQKIFYLDLSKFVDVHLEGLLQPHVDVVGLVAVNGIPLEQN